MKRLITLSVLAGTTCLGLAAMTSNAAASGPTCDGGVIQLGGVSSVTGPVVFAEVPDAAKATFDQINANGGINGCKIEYTIADDKADPQVAAQAARDLIDNKGVVAMVGAGSLLECAVNAGTYADNNVMAVQGLGVDAACFASPSVSPVNVGPFTLTTAMLQFADTQLKDEKLCAFFYIAGGTAEAYTNAIKRWEQISGKTIHVLDLTLPVQGDLTAYALKARDAGCDAVLTNQVEPQIVQWINTVDAQKLEGIDWLFLAPGYSEGVASALATSQQPIYVGTEWEPYTEASDANKDWAAAMDAAGMKKTAFTQGGYLAATIMADVIKSIDGPVTRESVTAKLKEGVEMPYSIIGSAYKFGDAPSHASMQATKVMQLKSGAWTLNTPEWVILP